MNAKRILGPLVAVAFLATLGSMVYLRIQGSSEASAEETPADTTDLPEVSAAANFRTDVAIPVEGAAVVRDTLVISVTAAAEAAPWRTSLIVAQVEGPVRQIPVRENQRVGGGSLVLAIDTTDLALDLADAEAQLDQAMVSYRTEILFDDQIEDPEVRAERERVARARSGLDQREVAVQRAKLALQRASITAPFVGRVADIKVSEGHRVRAGDELMTLVDIDPIRVEVQVLESEIGFIAEGRQAQVTFAAFPGETFVGRITSINPLVERESRTARVTVRIPNPDGRILPGMYARVSLEARRFPDRIIVPKSAVLLRDRREMLFVFQSDGGGQQGLAKWEYVTTGLENDSLVEIVPNPEQTPLEPGMIVLIGGHNTLIHDARVQLANRVSGEGARPQ